MALGKMSALILPYGNTEMMSLFLMIIGKKAQTTNNIDRTMIRECGYELYRCYKAYVRKVGATLSFLVLSGLNRANK